MTPPVEQVQQAVGAKPRLRVLSEEQAQAIHDASLQVLQRTGYHVPVPEARELLRAAGARVEGERVYIPESLVEQALKTLKPVTVYDRCGQPVMPLAQGRVTFGILADTIFVVDPYQRTNRPYTRADQPWFATILDALLNIDWIMCVGQAIDVPNELQTQMAVLQTVRRTTKPIWALPYDRAGLLDILELFSVIAGGKEALRQRPCLICASVPAAPLSGTVANIELLLTCAETETPMVTYSCPALGGNCPCSVAGTLALTNADWLANVVMHQLKHPGAPLCTAGFTVQVMDMKTTLWSYCAPETFLAYAAVTDLAHWYGMPAWGLEMCTDSPQLDAQAGAEMMAECLWAMLSGVEMVHNAGIKGSGKVCCAEGVILADEIIAYTKAMMNPPVIRGTQLSEGVDLIAEIGPLGEYVSHPHTLEHFRDIWYPALFDRGMFDPMKRESGPGLADRLNVRARHLIETHQPAPLPDDMLAELDRLEASWYTRVGAH
jgi:trimethylamine--corrinoid protein Co-methyltransferase